MRRTKGSIRGLASAFVSQYFLWGVILACSNLFGLINECKAESETDNPPQQFVLFDLLNKLSAKKHRIKVPIGSAYLIQDIRIVPRSCQKIKDTVYKADPYQAHVEIFLEQDMGDPEDQLNDPPPILLYKGDLSSNLLTPSTPVEHPIYDLILVACE